ncbi:hypothetical protein AGMMS49992_14330 [Clostridia bacterium]|nr:hypothetical protein AGMMS49992_14330 [Clostridia bacterium]
MAIKSNPSRRATQSADSPSKGSARKSSGGSVVQGLLPRLTALADGMGDVIVDAAFVREPHGQVLRITIDRPGQPGGVTLSDCEAFHRALIPLVESVEYDTLEVESPGADRPIQTDEEFAKAVNTDIEINLYKAEQGAKHWRGVLLSFDKDAVTLLTPQVERTLQRRSIAIARPWVSLDEINTQDNDF